jgi:hypothetical protein
MFKEIVRSYFPKSAQSRHSTSDGYLVTVESKNGNVLISEFGKTPEEAWKNVHARISETIQPFFSQRAATTLLMNPNLSNPL